MSPRLLRGSVNAAAVLLDPHVIGEAEARRRVLGFWTRGSTVRRLAGGWLLVWPEPRRIRVTLAPGLPFERRGGRLLGVEIDDRTLEAASFPGESIVSLRKGTLTADAVALLPIDDPAMWLEVAAYEIAAAAPLTIPPPSPSVSLREAPLFDLRERLSIVADPEARRVADSLISGPKAVGSQLSSAGTLGDRLRGLWHSLRTWWRPSTGSSSAMRPMARGSALARLVHALRRLLRSSAGVTSAGGNSWLPESPSRARLWWSRLLRRWLLLTRLSTLIGQHNARYVARVMRLFEDGDLDSALRHAVPLGRDGQRSELLSWATPKPRATLAVHAFAQRRTSVVDIGGELFGTLQRLYRSAHERLAAAGRFDEAAFVLAELLQANEEAIAFLERHGRLLLAAELAEGRNLAPGLQVRQWFLAGETARALEIAWRRGAFTDAVVRLERSGRNKEAAALRLRWADTLASAGEYAGAVDAVWPLEEARHLARHWITLAIAQGGPDGARMLVRRLALEPTAFEEVRGAATALLDDDSADLALARSAFAHELRRLAPSRAAATLARAAVRALVRDAAILGGGLETTDRAIVRGLAKDCADAVVAADMPEWPQDVPVTLAQRESPLTLEWRGDDAGRLPAEDAALLPDGRLVVALGELGARLLSRQGRTAAEIDQPTNRLVVSDHGDRAIALAQRGGVWRLARLDFAQHRGESWCEARLTAFAPSYDGRLWFIAADDALHAIDVSGTAGGGFDGPWRVGDLRVESIARVEKGLQVLVGIPGGLEQWVYETPSMTLRQREGVAAGAEEERVVVLAEGRAITLAVEDADAAPQSTDEATPVVQVRFDSRSAPPLPLTPGGRVVQACTASGWLSLTVSDPAGVTIHLLDTVVFRARARMRLERASRAAVRLSETRLTLADDLGRVIVLDLDAGRLLRDLRL